MSGVCKGNVNHDTNEIGIDEMRRDDMSVTQNKIITDHQSSIIRSTRGVEAVQWRLIEVVRALERRRFYEIEK